MKLFVDIKNYTPFTYSPYLNRGREVEAPNNSKYVVGQVVAVKREEGEGKEELAVVLGCIDEEFDGDLRLDLCGMTCIDKIRPAVKSDLKNPNVVCVEKLLKEFPQESGEKERFNQTQNLPYDFSKLCFWRCFFQKLKDPISFRSLFVQFYHMLNPVFFWGVVRILIKNFPDNVYRVN